MGLAVELEEKSVGAASWYRAILDSVVIPNGRTFGVVIIFAEVVVGLALLASAALWAFRWGRLGDVGRTAVCAATIVAALGGVLMNINFHLANGSAHPWLIPGDGFDEGVDLDSFMPLVQVVLAIVAWRALRRVRSERRSTAGASPSTSRAPGSPAA